MLQFSDCRHRDTDAPSVFGSGATGPPADHEALHIAGLAQSCVEAGTNDPSLPFMARMAARRGVGVFVADIARE